MSNYIEKKKRVARRQGDYLHFKGAVLGTFEDQTSNGTIQEYRESKLGETRSPYIFLFEFKILVYTSRVTLGHNVKISFYDPFH